MLKNQKAPIYEQDLEKYMIKNKNRIEYTTNFKDVYKNANVIFICVGTPEKKDGSANLKYIYTVANEIAKNMEKDCTIIIKSTVPIGTNDEIESQERNLDKTKENQETIGG